MIGTPRTVVEAGDGWSGDAICVPAEFARGLERELDAATKIGNTYLTQLLLNRAYAASSINRAIEEIERIKSDKISDIVLRNLRASSAAFAMLPQNGFAED